MNSPIIQAKVVVQEYLEGASIPELAEKYNTYNNKIRRILVKSKTEIRSRSEAQTLALASNRHKHPTKGTKLSTEVKDKISNSLGDYWDNISDEEREARVQTAKDLWEKMSDQDKENLRKLAGEGLRRAAKEGSKMEKKLVEHLKKSGFEVIFHKTGLIPNDKLEVDLFLPVEKIAIEIDGPAHFLPIWGEENLQKHVAADAKKSGLLINSGFKVIRVKNLAKTTSELSIRKFCKAVTEQIEYLSSKEFEKRDMFVELEIN